MIGSQKYLGEIFKALEGSQFFLHQVIKTEPLENSSLNKKPQQNKVTLQNIPQM